MIVLPLSVMIGVSLAVFLITCLLPAGSILLLTKLKVITDTGLNLRNERPIPYAITILCYSACAFYLYRMHSPEWLYMFMVGGAIAAVISLVINFRWKISAHGAALGGLVAMMFRILAIGVGLPSAFTLTVAAILVTGFVGTSRVYLERHTLAQVLCGIANGFICVYIMSCV